MGIVQDYINKLDKVTIPEQEKALLAIVESNGHALIDLVTGQLLKGKDGEGNFLQHYRSKHYADLKLLLNPLGVTDLRLSGDFWDGFYAVTKKFPIVINSTDNKRDELVKKYGDEIFWPDVQSKSAFREFIERDTKDYYRKVYSR